MNFEQRILRLEKRSGDSVPGTQLVRTLPGGPLETGIGWCLAIGCMQLPKKFFSGKTIAECLAKAEKELLKKKKNPLSPHLQKLLSKKLKRVDELNASKGKKPLQEFIDKVDTGEVPNQKVHLIRPVKGNEPREPLARPSRPKKSIHAFDAEILHKMSKRKN